MLPARKTTIGTGRPTGPAVPPRRWTGVGGACSPARAARLQHMLSLHQQFIGSRGSEPGSFPAHLPHAGQLPHSIRRLSDLAHQRDTQSVGGPLSPFPARPHDRRDRGRAACGGREAFSCAHTRQSCDGAGIEYASTVRAVAPFAGITRSGHFERFAGLGIQRDSTGSFRARRYGKIAYQSWPYRISANLAGHGSQTLVAHEAGK